MSPSNRPTGVDSAEAQCAAASEREQLPVPEELALLEPSAEQAFDRLTRLAANILHAPAALLSLVDGERSLFKSSVGLPEHWALGSEEELSGSVCQHVIAANSPVVINDARAHPLLSDNQAVAKLRIVAYLGIPLKTSAGHALGTFAVIDTVPREWSKDDVKALGDLAASAMTEIELRAATKKRLRMEQRLNLLESIVDNANVAVLIAESNPADSSDLRVVFVNDAYALLTGYSPIEVVARMDLVLKSLGTDRTQIDTIRTALASRQPSRVELYTQRKDGSAFWAELDIVPIADMSGEYSHWVIIQRDITELKHMKQRLTARHLCTRIIADSPFMDETIPKLLQALCESIGWRLGQMWQRDPKADLLRCVAHWHEPGDGLDAFADLSRNTTFRADIGLPGRVWASGNPLWVSDLAADAHCPRAEAAQHCGLHASFALPILRGPELLGILEFFHDDILVPDERLLSMIGEVGDQIGQFIERMRTDEALRDSEAQMRQLALVAQAANKAKSEFFSRMSHELRTPLNAILGFGQLLELGELNAPQRESAEQIIKGGRHLLALVNEVLDISRIEAGEAGSVALEEVDLGAAINEALGMIQPLANLARVKLLPPRPGSQELAVLADRQRLKQVLLNLLSNAIKYNRQDGAVDVTCEETAGAKLRICVTDGGPGIPPEKMHRLFAPFDRLEAEKKGVEGTGLGLTLSKGLAEAMRGTMGVESRIGQGSTFWIELPSVVKSKSATATAAKPASVEKPDPLGAVLGTVLCIEDNPDNILLLERIILLRPGVRLLTAVQGRLGLDLAREHRPDLIFTDLQLPDISGDEVLRRLRDHDATRDLPVVILSADASPQQIERLLAAGASRFLTKPFRVKEFLEIVDNALRPKKSGTETRL